MTHCVAITFDIDWAPDWAIEDCLALCHDAGVPVTIFLTHASPLIRRLRETSLLEIGIHPNFFPNSSQGADPIAVLDYCLDLVPNAKVMRCHSLMQSTRHFDIVADHCPSIQIDGSIFAPMQTNRAPVRTEYGAGRRVIERFATNWSDDYAAMSPGWTWRNLPEFPEGATVLAFHPVQLALNSAKIEGYERLKMSLGSRPLTEAGRDDVERFFHDGDGCRRFLERLLQATPKTRFLTISDALKHLRASPPRDWA